MVSSMKLKNRIQPEFGWLSESRKQRDRHLLNPKRQDFALSSIVLTHQAKQLTRNVSIGYSLDIIGVFVLQKINNYQGIETGMFASSTDNLEKNTTTE